MGSTKPPAKVTPKATPSTAPSPAPKPSNTPSRATANSAVTAAASAAQSKAATAQSKAAAAARAATSSTVTSAKTAKPASKPETKVPSSARGAATQAAFKAAEQLAQVKGVYSKNTNPMTRLLLEQSRNNYQSAKEKIPSRSPYLQSLINAEAARDRQRAKENQARQQSGKTQKPNKDDDKDNRVTRRIPPKNPGVLVIPNPQKPTTSTDPGGGDTEVDEEPTPETENIGAFSYSPPPSPPKQTLVPARDVVNFQSVPASVEAMEQVLFQQLSSFELVNMARRDTVEGLNPYYSVISNLSSIRKEYDPSQIIALQKPNQTLFDIYQINLYEKIPNDEYLLRNNISNFYYVDTNGDLIIELDNLLSDEIIEIEIATSGKIT